MQEWLIWTIPEFSNHCGTVDSLELESIITIDDLKKWLGQKYENLSLNELRQIRMEMYIFWQIILEN